MPLLLAKRGYKVVSFALRVYKELSHRVLGGSSSSN